MQPTRRSRIINKRITLGSLFDGIGGFPLSGTMCGIEPVWASEIEPFPIAVTMNRFPNMKHIGSVTDIKGDQIEHVDIITFGSPCQDLSVAGKQAGIHEGARSNLFFEAVRIIKEMRDHDRSTGRTGFDVRPRFAVWENVPGAFSSGKGKDFQAVLQTLSEVADPNVTVPLPEKGKWNKSGHIVGDGYSIAWRVYDAQYWGVPQRRKRIYLVADFGSERAGEILFERESVRGDSAQSREAREGAADDAAGGVGGISFFEPRSLMEENWSKQNIKNALRAEASKSSHAVVCSFMGGQGSKAGSIGYSEQVSPTLKSVLSGGNTVPDVVYQNTGVGWWNESHVAETLRTPCGGDSTKANLVVYDCRGNGSGDIVPNLTGDHQNRVTDYTAICVGNGQMHQTELGDKTGALNCMHDQQAVIHIAKPPRRYIVRRLTPLECCRLQGYPDGWTENISFDALSQEQVDQLEQIRRTWAEVNNKKYKPCKDRDAQRKWFEGLRTDSAEYKAYGNSLAIPCSYDVIRRVAKEIRRTNNERVDTTC